MQKYKNKEIFLIWTFTGVLFICICINVDEQIKKEENKYIGKEGTEVNRTTKQSKHELWRKHNEQLSSYNTEKKWKWVIIPLVWDIDQNHHL